MGIGPNLAANDAAKVIQNVTETTLINNRPPVQNYKIQYQI